MQRPEFTALGFLYNFITHSSRRNSKFYRFTLFDSNAYETTAIAYGGYGVVSE